MRLDQNDMTKLLQAWSGGDHDAGERLWAMVFTELRTLAHRQIRMENPGHTLDSRGLVNELYLRLSEWGNTDWHNRNHFFAMSARIMRQILVDHARAVRSEKRGGNASRVVFDETLSLSDVAGGHLLELDD